MSTVWRDAEQFPALDAARRARRTPTCYSVLKRKHVVEIAVDAFFVSEDVAERLSGLYGDYLSWWRARTTPERRWFPRHGVGIPDFCDFVHLTVLRQHADWWIRLMNEAGPLTYNRWDRAMQAWRAS